MNNAEIKIGEVDQIIVLLQQLNIPATYDNMSKLMCCLQLLASIKEKMAKNNTVEEDQNATDGNE